MQEDVYSECSSLYREFGSNELNQVIVLLAAGNSEAKVKGNIKLN